MNYSTDEKQYHIRVSKEDIGEYVILTGDPKRCEKIAKYIENPKLVADNREYVTFTGELNRTKVSVTSTGIGGPSAAIAMEELVKAGAHTFIRIGTCGGINSEVQSGDIIIATGAVRAEGTSREYAPIEYPAVANIEVVNALCDCAKDSEVRYHAGIIHSKDSFYGELEKERMPVSYELNNRWEALKRMGCLASEMESAALFIVAQYLQVKMGTVLLVMDNQEREAMGLENPVSYDTDKAVKVAIEAMKRLIH